MGMELYSLETSRDNHVFVFNPSLLACPEEKQPSRKILEFAVNQEATGCVPPAVPLNISSAIWSGHHFRFL